MAYGAVKFFLTWHSEARTTKHLRRNNFFSFQMPQTLTHPLLDHRAPVGENTPLEHRHIVHSSDEMRGQNDSSCDLPRPEARLLIACARTKTEASTQTQVGTAQRIELLLQEQIDWDYLLENALRHGLEPLLYWYLKAVAPEARQAIPSAVWREIEQSFFYNIGKNLFLTRELLRILAALAQQGIDAVPYKGPLVANAFYGNPALRQYCDLDIFVPRQDVLRARDVLRSLGFETEFQWTAAQESAHLHFEDEYVFYRGADETTVELHWEFNTRRSGSMLDAERLGTRREAVVLNGTTVRTFAAQDLFLVLCVHGYKHFWERLAWICDIAQIIKTRSDFDWDAMLLQAKVSGIQRILHLGLILAGDLLDAPLPSHVAEIVRRDITAQRLAGQVRANLFPTEYRQPTPWEMLRYHASMRERWRDKFGLAVRAATTPTFKDWAALPLPSSLFPLYYAVRPLRLTAEATLGRLHQSRKSVH
jgi:hypothetical protein